MSSTTCPDSNNNHSRERARARWKLLRAALLGEDVAVKATEYSIHRFAGYNLVPSSVFVDNSDLLHDILSSEGPLPGSHDLYEIKQYNVSANGLTVYSRQRKKQQTTKRSLDELTSHQHQGDIDNTGNICVWDCELTLAWFLRQSKQQPPSTILEVGAGMAGVAALAWWGVAQQIILTDGHSACVANNLVNVRLMEALHNDDTTRTTRARVELLRWGYEDDGSSFGADWTLVSDCTHFEEWHGQLLWTLLHHTAIQGSIWLCQPDRGKSWKRFADVVDAVNNGSGHSLLLITEQEDKLLEHKHLEFLKAGTGNFYQPDIHRPRIFCLTKMRDVTLRDKQVIRQHIENRS